MNQYDIEDMLMHELALFYWKFFLRRLQMLLSDDSGANKNVWDIMGQGLASSLILIPDDIDMYIKQLSIL